MVPHSHLSFRVSILIISQLGFDVQTWDPSSGVTGQRFTLMCHAANVMGATCNRCACADKGYSTCTLSDWSSHLQACCAVPAECQYACPLLKCHCAWRSTCCSSCCWPPQMRLEGLPLTPCIPFCRFCNAWESALANPSLRTCCVLNRHEQSKDRKQEPMSKCLRDIMT